MTKDRLTEMKTTMSENGITDSTEDLVGDEKSKLMSSFFEQIGMIRLEIQRIKNRIQIVKKFHQQIQKTINQKVRLELEEKVQQESLIITTSASQIRINLKAIDDMFTSQVISPAMQRMRDVQISSLVKLLEQVMQDYMQCLVEHRNKSIDILEKQVMIVSGESTIEDVQSLLEEGKIAIFNNNILVETLEAKLKLDEVESRHDEIIKIEKSIIELRNLFIELSFAVNMQGRQIDEIDRHVNKSNYQVVNARKETGKALKRKNVYKKRKIMLAGGCVTLIALLTLSLALL